MNLKDRWQLPPAEDVEPALAGQFGKGISPLNLRLDDEEGVSVSLGHDLPNLVREFAELGEAMITTGNGAVSLTQATTYPEFKLCGCGRRASNAGQGLHFDLHAWHSVWARQQKRGGDLWRVWSVAGENRHSAHQALWLEEEIEEKFAALARRFQGPTLAARQRRWEPHTIPGHETHAGFVSQFATRKKDVVENPRCGARLVSRTVLAEFWRGVLAEKIRLHTTVVSAPVIQALLWQPDSVTEEGADVFIRNPSAFLRCGVTDIAEVWLVPLLAEKRVVVSLEAYGPSDTLLFALTPDTDFHQPWHELLRWLPSL